MKSLIFLSHSSKDSAIAKKMCEYLEERGEKCFIAPRDIRYGNEYAEEIVNGIDNSVLMVLLLSENSNNSPHVLREVERAVSKSVPIVVYKLEEVELSKSMEYFLMTHQWLESKKQIDFSNLIECIHRIKNSVSTEKEAVADETKTDMESNNNINKSSNDINENSNSGRKDKKNYRIPAIIGIVIAIAVVIVVVYCMGNDRRTENGEGKSGSEHTAHLDIKVGDTVNFGRYEDEEIEWRVLKLSEDGSEAVLVSKYILSMKAFDAAEGGAYNEYEGEIYYAEHSQADDDQELQVKVRGNSDWSASNIRTWLNSEKEVVAYEGQAPITTAMSEHKNGYNNEPGFLYNFTEEEINSIVEVENITKGNGLAENETVVSKDRVYLLSLEDLKMFEEAGINYLAEPSQTALDTDGCKWFDVFSASHDTKYFYWWLREPVEGTSSKCYIVGNGYYEEKILKKNVGLEGYGIRPAMTVKVSGLQ